MIGVQDENALHGAREHGIGLVLLARRAEHHVEEIVDIGEPILGVHERLAQVVLVGHRGDRRQLRNQAEGRYGAAARIVNVDRVVVERGERPDHPAQHGHRMGITPETLIEAHQLLMHHGVPGDDAHEVVELLLVGQFAVEDQVGHLEEAAALGQLLDGIAPVLENTLVTVDVSDVGAATGRGHEARVVGELPGLCIERADIDHLRTFVAAQHWKVDRLGAVTET